MGRHLKSDRYACRRSEAAIRRVQRVMCMSCVTGSHSLCASEDCPCVCNDSDFRWSRKPSSETQREMAHVIAVRPELAELFR